MSRFKNPFLVIIVLLLALGGLVLIASNAGAMNFIKSTVAGICHRLDWQIWLNIRLPRVLIAILVGLALAVSGAIMQGLL